jgi:hypothetical protein
MPVYLSRATGDSEILWAIAGFSNAFGLLSTPEQTHSILVHMDDISLYPSRTHIYPKLRASHRPFFDLPFAPEILLLNSKKNATS